MDQNDEEQFARHILSVKIAIFVYYYVRAFILATDDRAECRISTVLYQVIRKTIPKPALGTTNTLSATDK